MSAFWKEVGKSGSKAGETMTGACGIEFVWCPPGTFMMGSPESETGRCSHERQHQVKLTKGFWIGKYPVTQKQFKKITGRNPSRFKGFFKGAQNPVEMVSWGDAASFCGRLTEVAPPEECWSYRLPTEAQWEFACRAGSTTAYCFGDDEVQLGDYAWYRKNSGGKTHPVGLKKPNAWGIHDMHGNVAEWCADYAFGDYPQWEFADPKGSRYEATQAFRRGGWNSDADLCRSASRLWSRYDDRSSNIGFRVAAIPVPRSRW